MVNIIISIWCVENMFFVYVEGDNFFGFFKFWLISVFFLLVGDR